MKRFRVFWRSWIFPERDYSGNLVRVAIACMFLFCLLLALVLIEPCAQETRVAALATFVLSIPPLIGGIYGIYQVERYRNSNQLILKTLLNEKPYAAVIAFSSFGLFSWGVGNFYWLGLQHFITHDYKNAPPLGMGCDFFFFLLDVLILLACQAWYKALNISVKKSIKEHKLTFIRFMLGGISVGILAAILGRGGLRLGEEDPLGLFIHAVYTIADFTILALLVLLSRITDLRRWASELWIGLRFIIIGWWIVTIVDMLYEIGYTITFDSPLHYETFSPYDFGMLFGLIFLTQGIFFLVSTIFLDHPHISFLSDSEQELARFVISGKTNAEIAKIYDRSESDTERKVTKLYKVTGFGGEDRTNKRDDFKAYYRNQIQAHFPEDK